MKLIREMSVRVDDDVLLQVTLEPTSDRSEYEGEQAQRTRAPGSGQPVAERWKACMTDRVEGLTVGQGRMISGFLQILVGALPEPIDANAKPYAAAFKSSGDKARARLVAEMKDEIDEQWQAIDNARKVLEGALWNAGVKPNADRGLVECAELAAARVQRLPEDDAQG